MERPSPAEYIELPDPECDGSGALYQVLTPLRDPRDPAYTVREFDCPGCIFCNLKTF